MRTGTRQAGAVLLVSLLVLLLLAVIATTVAATNQLQLHMAGNEEARTAALQRALAAVDAALAAIRERPVIAGVGYRLCPDDSLGQDCDERSIALPAGVRPATGELAVSVVRTAPLAARLPVMDQVNASSAVFYRIARLEVRARYDASALGLGRASLAQGVFVRQSTSTQSFGGQP